MPRITLEKHPSHDDLTAFAFAMGVISGLAAGVLAVAAGAGIVGFSATLLLTVVLVAGWGVGRPMGFSLAYRIWNSGARRYATVAQRFTMAVTFHLVFTTVSLVGARFARTRTGGESGWTAKTAPALKSQTGYVASNGEAEEWTGRLRRWSRGQPSRWSLFLLPFLSLLDSLEGQTAVKTAEDIYTLY